MGPERWWLTPGTTQQASKQEKERFISKVLHPFGGDTVEGPLVGPLVFLAGPIQGAPDWQQHAINMMRDKGAHLASPRTPWKTEYSEDDYQSQVEWEHQHLERASQNGVIMFWLAKEETHYPNRAYAQTTRYELGWHVQKALAGNCKIVIGIEPGFSNERYLHKTIRAQFKEKFGSEIEIYTTLEETCAASLAYGTRAVQWPFNSK